MIPPFDARGLLPPGGHWATWEEISERFGGNNHRQALLVGLRRALVALRRAGCGTVYLDGSFVTTKEHPADFDACWSVSGVNDELLDPLLLDFSQDRAAQKAEYGGELFPAEWLTPGFGVAFLDFFQIDAASGAGKGIVAVDLTGPV